MTGLREPLSTRFHRWLEFAAARALGKLGGEKLVFYADGLMLAKRGIMIGHEFTDPQTFRVYRCTKVEHTRTGSIAVYGRQVT